MKATTFLISLMLALAVSVSACKKEEEGPMEKLGHELDDAAHDLEDSVSDAADDVSEAMKDAAEEIEDAAEDDGS